MSMRPNSTRTRSLRRAKSIDAYVEWVKQAVFEVADLKECLLYEVEERVRFPYFIEPLEHGVKQLYQAMKDGNYHFVRKVIPFMDVAFAHADQIPFHTLLKQLNETQRHGLEVDENGCAPPLPGA